MKKVCFAGLRRTRCLSFFVIGENERIALINHRALLWQSGLGAEPPTSFCAIQAELHCLLLRKSVSFSLLATISR